MLKMTATFFAQRLSSFTRGKKCLYLGCDETLFWVQVGGGFVNEIYVSRLAETEGHRDALQLTSGQVLNFLRIKFLVSVKWWEKQFVTVSMHLVHGNEEWVITFESCLHFAIITKPTKLHSLGKLQLFKWLLLNNQNIKVHQKGNFHHFWSPV